MKHRSKSFRLTGLVLKRSKAGETDLLVTLLTQKMGRLVVVAKGARRLTSSKRAMLESGNVVDAFLIKTKSLSLLTQAKLINTAAPARDNLIEIRKLTQILEIFDKLFVEEEIEQELFSQVMDLRDQIIKRQLKNGQIKTSLENLIERLGYQHPQHTQYDSVLDYVAELSDRPMKSFQYLATSSDVLR